MSGVVSLAAATEQVNLKRKSEKAPPRRNPGNTGSPEKGGRFPEVIWVFKDSLDLPYLGGKILPSGGYEPIRKRLGDSCVVHLELLGD